jgi:UDP-N-acetylmuramate dehydrogenase
MRWWSAAVLEANADLGRRNTLRLPARAQWFAQPESDVDLTALLQDARYQSLPRIVIGDGSNLLLRADLDALVIRPAMRGMHIVEEDDTHVLIEVMAGENWDELVAETVRRGWQGLENLSLIPGAVGAAPYQNIGAYGVELADVFDSLAALSLTNGQQREFSRAECCFAYRDSFFKSHEPNRWVITRVRLRLNKSPSLVLGYADLRQRFEALPAAQQNVAGARELVCALRRSKLPDPQQLPNAGSFFKNPVIAAQQFRQLQQQFPGIVGYPQDNGDVKVAAGWLIEQAGWKGKREGDLGMHAQQALVLVNYGAATGEQVKAFAERVRASVREKFSVVLEQEPVVLP